VCNDTTTKTATTTTIIITVEISEFSCLVFGSAIRNVKIESIVDIKCFGKTVS
jgi:hypothetical protein